MGTESHDTSRRTILKGSALGAGALLGAASLPSKAHAATPAATPNTIGAGPVEYFLKVDSATLPLYSYSFDATRRASEGRSTASRGTAGQIHFSAPMTKTSPLFMLNMVSGKVVKTATITGTTTETNQPFLKIELSEVVVSSYQSGGFDGEVPTDNGTLSYGKISFSYYTQEAAGGPPSAVSIAWDVRADKWTS